MIMNWNRFERLGREPGYYRQWVSNAQSFHGAVFTYIEALILLAVLQFAAVESGSWVIWAIVAAAYTVHLALTGTYIRAWIMLILVQRGPKGRLRGLLIAIGSAIGILANFGLIWGLQQVIDGFIGAGLAT